MKTIIAIATFLMAAYVAWYIVYSSSDADNLATEYADFTLNPNGNIIIPESNTQCSVDSDCVKVFTSCNIGCDCGEYINSELADNYGEKKKVACDEWLESQSAVGICDLACEEVEPKCIGGYCVAVPVQ